MKFEQIDHYDHFDNETVFWADITDMPEAIQNKAREIDGAGYDPLRFGVCAIYDQAKKEFDLIVDVDPSTGEHCNMYYIDTEGDKHWLKAEFAPEFIQEIFMACNENLETIQDTNERSRYFQELSRNLRYEGLAVKSETEEGLLPVELDGQRLCLVLDTGAVRYWKEDVADDHRSAALDRVTDVAKITAEYMRQLETAPQLTASGLTGDYRLLAEFNDTVLAGHPSKYGVQFITWEWVRDHTALYQGNYYGPEGGTDSYAAAKRNFAVRSGLVPRSALFAPEQLTEVYRCIQETLESEYPITDERQKCLESAAEQIERCVPNLDARVMESNRKEELAAMESPQDGGMQFS